MNNSDIQVVQVDGTECEQNARVVPAILVNHHTAMLSGTLHFPDNKYITYGNVRKQFCRFTEIEQHAIYQQNLADLQAFIPIIVTNYIYEQAKSKACHMHFVCDIATDLNDNEIQGLPQPDFQCWLETRVSEYNRKHKPRGSEYTTLDLRACRSYPRWVAYFQKGIAKPKRAYYFDD